MKLAFLIPQILNKPAGFCFGFVFKYEWPIVTT